MPKIDAASIPEHVEARERAIISTAVELFAEHGVHAVTIGDIANRVGFARTSVYRYFPTKAAILGRWFEDTMAPILDASIEIARSDAPARDRLEQWIDLHLDVMADPANHLMINATVESDDLPEDTRTTIAEQHHAVYETLAEILADNGPVDEAVQVRTVLVTSLLGAITQLVATGIPSSTARSEIRRAVAAITTESDRPRE